MVRDDLHAGACARQSLPRSDELYLRLLIDQDGLLPSTWRLVRPVNATGPTTRPLLAFQQFLAGSPDAALARHELFCVIDPADELVPSARGKAFPKLEDLRFRSNGGLEVVTGFVNGAMGKSFCHKPSCSICAYISEPDPLEHLRKIIAISMNSLPTLQLVQDGLKPDLLVTDHLMSGMNGTDLARIVQTERPGTRVLIVSGYADAEGVAPDLARLTKPFRHDELAASIAELSQSR